MFDLTEPFVPKQLPEQPEVKPEKMFDLTEPFSFERDTLSKTSKLSKTPIIQGLEADTGVSKPCLKPSKKDWRAEALDSFRQGCLKPNATDTKDFRQFRHFRRPSPLEIALKETAFTEKMIFDGLNRWQQPFDEFDLDCIDSKELAAGQVREYLSIWIELYPDSFELLKKAQHETSNTEARTE